MGRLQVEGIATKNNDSEVSVLISESDQAIQSNMPVPMAARSKA